MGNPNQIKINKSHDNKVYHDFFYGIGLKRLESGERQKKKSGIKEEKYFLLLYIIIYVYFVNMFRHSMPKQ